MRASLVTVSLALLLAPSEQLLRRDEEEEGSGDYVQHSLIPRLPVVVDTESSGDLPRNYGHHHGSDGDEDVEIGSGTQPTLKTMRTSVHNITAATLIPNTTTSKGAVSSTVTPSSTTASSSAHGHEQSRTDIIYIDSSAAQGGVHHARPTSSSGRPLPPVATRTTSSAGAAGGVRLPQPTNHWHMHNVVPSQTADVDSSDDEAKEEDSNVISNAGYAVAESRMGFGPAHGGLHPGLLAAVIGGGVVGLLCAILLVMFVVYRLRKRDEGGYTTVDSKPRLNTYTKASSREFYA